MSEISLAAAAGMFGFSLHPRRKRKYLCLSLIRVHCFMFRQQSSSFFSKSFPSTRRFNPETVSDLLGLKFGYTIHPSFINRPAGNCLHLFRLLVCLHTCWAHRSVDAIAVSLCGKLITMVMWALCTSTLLHVSHKCRASRLGINSCARLATDPALHWWGPTARSSQRATVCKTDSV